MGTLDKSGAPTDDDNKMFVRSESRPLDMSTCFMAAGDKLDAVQAIGEGKKLCWDFSNNNDEVASGDSMMKRKRVEFQFLDPIRIKEGTTYWLQAVKGSYIDLYVVCPAGQYYLSNDKSVRQAAEDMPIEHFVQKVHMIGDCPMGDELNTEAASSEIPAHYKFWLEVTTPIADVVSHGHVCIELYRQRTVILP